MLNSALTILLQRHITALILPVSVWTVPASRLAAVAALAEKLLGEDHVRSLEVEVFSFDQFAHILRGDVLAQPPSSAHRTDEGKADRRLRRHRSGPLRLRDSETDLARGACVDSSPVPRRHPSRR